jgi:hypothetical protein
METLIISLLALIVSVFVYVKVRRRNKRMKQGINPNLYAPFPVYQSLQHEDTTQHVTNEQLLAHRKDERGGAGMRGDVRRYDPRRGDVRIESNPCEGSQWLEDEIRIARENQSHADLEGYPSRDDDRGGDGDFGGAGSSDSYSSNADD